MISWKNEGVKGQDWVGALLLARRYWSHYNVIGTLIDEHGTNVATGTFATFGSGTSGPLSPGLQSINLSPFTNYLNWTLDPTFGLQTIEVELRDDQGATATSSDTIDYAAPAAS